MKLCELAWCNGGMSDYRGVNSRRTVKEIKFGVWGQNENAAINLLVYIFVRLTSLYIYT